MSTNTLEQKSTENPSSLVARLIVILKDDHDMRLVSLMRDYTGIHNISDLDARKLLELDQDKKLCPYRWGTHLKSVLIFGYQPQGSLAKCRICKGHGKTPDGESCGAYMRRQKYE